MVLRGGERRRPEEVEVLAIRVRASIQQQPAGIYVVRGALIEAVPWADVAGSDGTPCIWKIEASGLTAMPDAAYPENPNLLRLVGRRVRADRP